MASHSRDSNYSNFPLEQDLEQGSYEKFSDYQICVNRGWRETSTSTIGWSKSLVNILERFLPIGDRLTTSDDR